MAAGIGRAIVVTHFDQENTNFEQVVADLREAFGHAVVPVTYPNAVSYTHLTLPTSDLV